MIAQLLVDTTLLIVPLVYGLAVFVLLILIERLLVRAGLLRGFGIPYIVGTLALGSAVGLTTGLDQFGLAMDATLYHALLALVVCAWGFVGLKLVEDLLVERWIRQRGAIIPRLMLDIGRGLAFIVVILLTLSFVLGVQLSSIVISSTILTAVIGLALQDLLKNVIAGIALQGERPFEVGHWVEINKQIGRVVEMSWRATRVITIDGNYVIYPNSNLAQTELINYTMGSPVQALHVQIAVGYTHAPNLVKQVLTAAALATPDVCREPPPSIKLVQYGDYSVTYDIKFWLYDFERYTDKRDAVMTSAWYHLHRADIKLPLPIREVYLHQADPASVVDQRQLQLEHLVATLRRVDLFAMLDSAELHALAEHTSRRLYGTGELLARQGELGDSFFIIYSGHVRIDVEDDYAEHHAAVTVNRLGPGEFFGELALLTGAPRGATVIAEGDIETLVVARDDLAPLLHANPELPERMGAVLARRLEMNQVALASHRATESTPAEDMSRPTLVHRIRQIFGVKGRHGDGEMGR